MTHFPHIRWKEKLISLNFLLYLGYNWSRCHYSFVSPLVLKSDVELYCYRRNNFIFSSLAEFGYCWIFRRKERRNKYPSPQSLPFPKPPNPQHGLLYFNKTMVSSHIMSILICILYIPQVPLVEDSLWHSLSRSSKNFQSWRLVRCLGNRTMPSKGILKGDPESQDLFFSVTPLTWTRWFFLRHIFLT